MNQYKVRILYEGVHMQTIFVTAASEEEATAAAQRGMTFQITAI